MSLQKNLDEVFLCQEKIKNLYQKSLIDFLIIAQEINQEGFTLILHYYHTQQKNILNFNFLENEHPVIKYKSLKPYGFELDDLPLHLKKYIDSLNLFLNMFEKQIINTFNKTICFYDRHEHAFYLNDELFKNEKIKPYILQIESQKLKKNYENKIFKKTNKL